MGTASRRSQPAVMRSRERVRMKMTLITKYMLSAGIFLCLLAGVPSLGTAEPIQNDSGIFIKDGRISASLRNAPLPDILRQIEAQEGIWFKFGIELKDERVSVRFADLPREQALERLLARISHSIIYDGAGKVVGVIILARSGHGRYNASSYNAGPRKVRTTSHYPKISRATAPSDNPDIKPLGPADIPMRPPGSISANTNGISTVLKKAISH